MRDRLETLQRIREEQEDDVETETYGPDYDVDNDNLSQDAVVFDSPAPMDIILKEAHNMRKEISQICLEVERLAKKNERFGCSTRRLTLLKQDSDYIARGVQERGEAFHARLQALGERSRLLEQEEGPASAASRIARTQHQTLTRAFQAVMADYGRAEALQRETCRRRLQRQASIMGANIGDEQLNVLVDKGGEGWVELSQSLQMNGGHSSRWALCEIKGRHKELVELEARMKEVHDLFLSMAMMVEEQGSMLNNIEANVCGTQDYIDNINVHIKTALQYKKKNPFQQCCPCLPCWRPVI